MVRSILVSGLDLEKQIDEHETSEITNNNKQTMMRKTAITNDETTMQKQTEDQTENPRFVAAASLDFSNLTTDVGDNPLIRRPSPIESPPIPPRSPPTVVRYNLRKTGKYNLRPNPKPNANPDFN